MCAPGPGPAPNGRWVQAVFRGPRRLPAAACWHTPRALAADVYRHVYRPAGQFYESLNMATLYKLPCIFVVENNKWAIGMNHPRATAPSGIADNEPWIYKKGPAFGMPGVHVDGMDVMKAGAGRGGRWREGWWCAVWRQRLVWGAGVAWLAHGEECGEGQRRRGQHGCGSGQACISPPILACAGPEPSLNRPIPLCPASPAPPLPSTAAVQVREVAMEAVERARRGEGPTLIEAETYRYRGHSLADPDELRRKEEKEHYAVGGWVGGWWRCWGGVLLLACCYVCCCCCWDAAVCCCCCFGWAAAWPVPCCGCCCHAASGCLPLQICTLPSGLTPPPCLLPCPAPPRPSVQARDPIPQFAKYMVANGLATESDIKALEAKVKEVVDDCVEYAENSPKPVSGWGGRRWRCAWCVRGR